MPRAKKTAESTVDEKAYPERPLKDALADPKDIEAAEARSETDQIEDYHQKHPTLKVDRQGVPEGAAG